MIVTIRSSSSDVISPALLRHQYSALSAIFLHDIPLVQVNIGLLANQVGVSTTNTLDSSQGVHNLHLAIDVGVEETQNELDFARLVLVVARMILVAHSSTFLH